MMTTEQKSDGWFASIDCDDERCFGPHKTRAEALEDARAEAQIWVDVNLTEYEMWRQQMIEAEVYQGRLSRSDMDDSDDGVPVMRLGPAEKQVVWRKNA